MAPTSPTPIQNGDPVATDTSPVTETMAESAALDAENTAEASRKLRPGRRPGIVWEYFTNVKTETNKTHALCNFCQRQCAGVASRMVQHILKKCPSAPTHAIEALSSAAQEPPEKRQRVGGHVIVGGLAAFAGNEHQRLPPIDVPQPETALQYILVAFLRTKTSVSVLEDEFFRHALTLLQPELHETVATLTGAELLKRVAIGMAQETERWMQEATVFTMVHRCVAGDDYEWRGVDHERRQLVVADTLDASLDRVHGFLTSQAKKCGEETVVGVCCDSYAAYKCFIQYICATDASSELASRVGVIGRCLLRSTLQVWAKLVEMVPVIEATAQNAAAVVHKVEVDAGQPVELSRGWRLPFAVLTAAESFQSLPMMSHSVEASSFWDNVAAVNKLVAPLLWMLVLCESKHVCSSDVVFSWLWLLARIEASGPLLTDDVRSTLSQHVVEIMCDVLEDHHIVAYLLDPRIAAVGLSASGKRKAKSLVIQLAAKLAREQDTESQTRTRQALVTQLAHYVDKSSYFADDVAWEMARTSSPLTFWTDYADDAPALARLAMTVLSYAPTASLTSECVHGASDAVALESRQIQFHFERNQKNGALDKASVLAKHASLFPQYVDTTASPVAVSQRPDDDTWAALLAEQLDRLRAVGTSVSSQVGVGGPGVVDSSWFAFSSESDCTAIELSARKLITASLMSVRVPSTTAAVPANMSTAVPAPIN